MKLTTKLLLFFVPLLTLTLMLLGMWSYNLAEKSTRDHETRLLQILSNHIIQKLVESRVDLLKQSGLDGVASFEKSFKEEVFSELRVLSVSTGKSFHIFGHTQGNVIFSSAPEAYSQALSTYVVPKSGEPIFGNYFVGAEEQTYIAYYFEYWDWNIYVSESVSVIAQPIKQIRDATIMAVTIASVLSAIMFWWVINYLIIKPVNTLQQVTQQISKEQKQVDVPIKSDDELGSLARDVERMSHEIESSIIKVEDANRAKSEFLATMSHEIRTPLNGLVGLTKILSDTDISAKQKELINALNLSSQTLSSIINDVLDLSKIESGKLTLEVTKIDPYELVDNVNSIFKSTASENLTILECSASIPHNVILMTDIVRIRQILFNIVGNAVKFTHKGNIDINLSVQHVNGQDLLRIVCKDTGVGIEQDRLEAIFDAFTQSDTSTTRNYGGSGLGLSIVQKLLDLLGGTINVSSKINQGSCFTIEIPVKTVHKKARSKQEFNAQAPHIRPNIKVLLVEDHEINRMVAKVFLEKYKCVVLTAQNGEEALHAATKHHFDIILMDIHMPVMDGVEATKAIRKIPSEKSTVPIVGLTAEAFEDSHKVFIAAGMNDVITKPIDDVVMITKIHNALLKQE